MSKLLHQPTLSNVKVPVYVIQAHKDRRGMAPLVHLDPK